MPSWLKDPIVVALVTAVVTWWLAKLSEAAKTKRERTAAYKVDCYSKLMSALNKLAFNLALERECRGKEDADATPRASTADMASAKEAVLLAHVCGYKSLVDAAWAAFLEIVREQVDDAKVTELLCRLATEIRAGLGLDLAPFDQKSINEVEKLMVRSCCMRERYKITVTNKQGKSASLDR